MALREVYRGAGLQWARTGPMMTLYFCLLMRASATPSTPAGSLVFASSTPARNGSGSMAVSVSVESGGCA